MRALVEVQYYDGGLVSEIIPDRRDLSIPDLPRGFGLKSNEAEIAARDYVVEFADMGSASTSLRWLGVYTGARDFALGDRGGYCGVGVWLVGATIKHGLHLLNLLKEAADHLAASTGFSDEMRFRLVAFARELPDLDWCVPDRGASAVCAAATPIQSSYLRLDGNDRNCLDLVGIDILGRTLLASLGSRPSRRVYFLTGAGRIFVPTQKLEFANALTYAEDMIHRAQQMMVSAQANRAAGNSSKKAFAAG